MGLSLPNDRNRAGLAHILGIDPDDIVGYEPIVNFDAYDVLTSMWGWKVVDGMQLVQAERELREA